MAVKATESVAVKATEEKTYELLPIKTSKTDVQNDTVMLAAAKKQFSDGIQIYLTGDALEDNRKYGKVAAKMKLHMDKNYKKTWHVVVGKNFGSQVVHEQQSFMMFEYEKDKLVALMWKAGC